MSAELNHAAKTSGAGRVFAPLVGFFRRPLEALRRWRDAARARSAAALRACVRFLWPEVAVAIVLAAASVLVFHNSLNNTYALDDYYRVVDNPGIQRFWSPARHFLEPGTMSTLDRITQYRPLLPLSFSIDYAIAGNSVVAHHIGNLILQFAASVLAFLLALELMRHAARLTLSPNKRVLAAGVAALIFAIHPVSGVAVNYISARDLLLMQVFFLGALLAYARMRRLGENAGRWNVVILLLVLSLLSKTNLVVAPLLWLAFDLLIKRDSPGDWRVWLRAVGISALVGAFFVLTQLALGFSDLQQVVQAGGSWINYGLTQLRLHLFYYLPHFWWPFGLHLLPRVEAGSTSDYRVWLGLAFLISTLVLAWRMYRQEPLVAFCILAYWILMIPESSLLPLHQAAADYRPYPASVFLLIALSLAAVQYLSTRRFLLASGLFTAFVGATSFTMNRNWRSGEELWLQSVNHGGDATAHMNLAMSIPQRSDPRVLQNLEEALRLNPNFVLAHINICLLQTELGDTAGVARCEKAVALQPDWAQSHYWLATAYQRAGRPWDAVRASTRAVQLDPDNVEYHYHAALHAQHVRDWNSSLEHVNQVRARVVNYKELSFVRGFALQMLRRNEEAVVEYRRQLAVTPDNAQVSFNTGFALMTLGRCAEAHTYFQQTLKLQPEYSDARHYMERCQRQLAPPPTRSEVRVADRAAPRAARARPARKGR